MRADPARGVWCGGRPFGRDGPADSTPCSQAGESGRLARSRRRDRRSFHALRDARRTTRRSANPDTPQVLDVVALTEDLPAAGLKRRQVGTVVETLARGVFEVEFSDDQGCTYAMASVRSRQLLVLHRRPVEV